LDIVQGERAEAELARIIERRTRKGEVDCDENEELWKESVRAYTAKRNAEMRAEWRRYHAAQAEVLRRTLEGLISHHEQQSAKLTDVQPKGAAQWPGRDTATATWAGRQRAGV
jgi:hypothetical protein